MFSKRCENENFLNFCLTQLTTNRRDPDLLGVVIFDTRAAEGQAWATHRHVAAELNNVKISVI